MIPSLSPCHTLDWSYPDPVAGASHSFIQRISELSSLEGETIRQEKLKKLRKTRKHDSWQQQICERTTTHRVPKPFEQSPTFAAPCSFQWLVLTACISSVVLVYCSAWLVFTIWDSWLVFIQCQVLYIENTSNAQNNISLLWQMVVTRIMDAINEIFY